MFKLAVAALASAWLVEAQEPDNNAYHPHAAFAFIRTGERTPILRKGQPTLTALGASQMFELGKNFRTRYIAGTSPNGLGVEHISGLSKDILNINQIQIRTLDSPYLVASAQAFMQGLYPPTSIANNNGSMGAATGLLADGRAIDFPLSGYQYPNIETTSLDAPSSVFVAGSEACPISQRDSMMYFTTGKFRDTLTANRGFYNSSLKVEYFEGNLKPDEMDYTYALEIADYMQYQYMHNLTINRALDNATMARIQSLADEEAWYLWGNTSASSSDADNQAIAGKTLASSILGSFQKLIIDQLSPGDKTDMSYPLTFFFGEQQPFISLISLMMADYKDTSFRSIPPWGSAMIFELFSTGNSTAFPTNTDNLWVRFYFHNGTAFDAKQLLAFPIFGNGRSRTDMPWSEFSLMFNQIALKTLNGWCATCASPALFCTGVGDDQTNSLIGGKNNQKHYAVSPAVGGVIGAIVTLVVAGLIFGLAMLLGGVRFHRVHKSKKSELGGFKGSAKLASDQDLSIAKNGAPPAGLSFVPDRKVGHERVGSWELRQKEMGVGEERRESLDAIDAVTAKPVQPHERV